MKRCKHDPADHVRVLNCTLLGNPITLVCDKCGINLPLGPSNDVGCEIEIRAAEIALLAAERKDAPINWCGFAEWLGFDGDRHASGEGFDTGYLARCIHEHKEQS